MRKTFLTVAAFLLLLNSCGNKSETAKSAADIYLVQKSCDNNMVFFYMGEEKLYDLKELGEDRSAPEVSGKVRKLYSVVKQMDSEADKSLEIIHKLQLKILKSKGANINKTGENFVIMKMDKNDPGRPISFDLSKISAADESSILDESNKKEIINSLENFRKISVELLVSSAGNEEIKYSFRDPEISKYSSVKDLITQLDAKIKSSKVSPDDQEVLKKIYAELTETISFAKKIMSDDNNWLTDFEILSALESEILKARYDLLSTLRSRVSGCNYSFNKIMPVVFGTDIVRQNEEIELKVIMAAVDSDKQPKVEVKEGTVTNVSNGVATIKIPASKAGKFIVKGTITIMNKSGIPKTLPWEKEILIIE